MPDTERMVVPPEPAVFAIEAVYGLPLSFCALTAPTTVKPAGTVTRSVLMAELPLGVSLDTVTVKGTFVAPGVVGPEATLIVNCFVGAASACGAKPDTAAKTIENTTPD